MSSENSDFVERFVKLLGMLGSDHAGERESAAHAIHRLCDSTGMSIADVAILLEQSDAAANKIYAKGVERGREQAQIQGISATYLDSDCEPRWHEMVEFCLNNVAFTSLTSREQQFINDMPGNLQHWGSPTRSQGGFVLSVFWKLGGEFK